MATLVLTAAGTAIGGPIGGAIGAMIGQQVDQNVLFKPKGREGPRLQELAVQTSSYGAQVPRIYGRMRVAGTVVWATDLKETRSREGGGKGRPSTTIYSYSACFAVALSSRQVQSIGRIWADGKIFRGVAGDFKTATQFTFHAGSEDQPVDGLMASAEANDGTPAYRGLALAVFEDMDLTEYGNRIPSLTFEVIADDGSVSIAEIVTDLSGDRIVLPAGEALIGYAAGGEDRHAALRSLTDSIPLSFSSDPVAIDRIEAEVRLGADPATGLKIDGDFVRVAGRQEIALPEQRSASISATPRQLSVRYYDPARDYQSGIQSASRPGAGRISLARDFPATMAVTDARALALDGLWSAFDERSSLHVSLALGREPYRPGLLVRFGAFEGLWRIRQCEIGRGFVQLSLTRAYSNKNLSPIESEQGRNVPDSDLIAGSTRLVLVDLPFAIDAPTAVSDSARLYAAAAGDVGWRNAQLFASGPDGATGAYIGQIAAPTIMGTTLGTLDPANPALIDQLNSIDVEMRNPAMALAYADESQLLAGSNVAVIGGEVIQFAEAVPLGNGQYRLTRLIRGLGGTEAEIAWHSANEDFILLDAASMLEIASAIYPAFSPTTVFALGRDDLAPVSASIASPGRALLPWSPVHPTWNFLDNGDLAIGWTRRSRAGAIWSDHVEVPLAEEVEKYRVELSASDGSVVPVLQESATPLTTVPAAQIEPFFINNISDISAQIFQVGAHGRSAALVFEIPL
ncbi:phage tail protein [uncultured Parasphingorhabdus sp.]|uniref:GTA baseplate fiber-binding domain-containing protein n=1 Tax=uncultured Parasphingorhabdus sp. TaxID=2709694 RepID=UPI0030DC4656|tara:strand:+ start:27871 stop:30096 length:2226 start_codon:yes stop_codon:yes gene_type:complete